MIAGEDCEASGTVGAAAVASSGCEQTLVKSGSVAESTIVGAGEAGCGEGARTDAGGVEKHSCVSARGVM